MHLKGIGLQPNVGLMRSATPRVADPVSSLCERRWVAIRKDRRSQTARYRPSEMETTPMALWLGAQPRCGWGGLAEGDPEGKRNNTHTISHREGLVPRNLGL
jgi:hypothetical protein